ncbi:putative 2-dehydropantoate 2-reductase [Clavispora lusitaniae]|uniref:2-dehydropantoate 2-reductase n=1 Tax=Clavispora lusitaniae TaxID=36911 RepID=A0AA91T0V3_CLALS|nr:putative 2-dehydropantoate 2-reductase [Clavispora lusitaniae]
MHNILVFGSGGVGSIAAYALDLAEDTSVTTIIRSDYDQVTKNGYKITSVDYGTIEAYKPSNVVKSIDEAKAHGPFDYVVISTKNTPDITKTEELVEPTISEGKTVILLMQNGIGIEESFLTKYPNNIVLSGVSMISSTNYDGVIDHVGHDFLKVGYFENPNIPIEKQKQAALQFVSLYHNGKNECVYDEDVKYTRWRKLVYNATLNSICTLTNVDVGRLQLFGGVDSLVRSAMKEVLAIAKSDGVELDESIIDFMIHSDDGVYYAPSMLVDLRKGNYIELEVISGNPVKIAQKNGVEAPTLTLIYNLLKVIQMRIKEAKGAISVPEIRPVPDGKL